MREAVKDPILFVGRTPIFVDFTKPRPRAHYESGQVIVQVPQDEANCWISRSRLDHNMHIPCFDLDADRDACTPLIRQIFPEEKPTFVPSTTPGHHHVYIEYAYTAEDYFRRLYTLAIMPIIVKRRAPIKRPLLEGTPVITDTYDLYVPSTVETIQVFALEAGYLRASKNDGGTVVRMPHIKKVLRIPEDIRSLQHL